MNNRKYAVFILTHGRADRVYTYKMLKNYGYTGAIYLLCDDEDQDLNEYKRRYGDRVIVFSKKALEGTFDMMDNFDGRDVVVYARNHVHKLAKDMGFTHYIEVDDDYHGIYHVADFHGIAKWRPIKNLDKLFEYTLDLLDETGALVIAYAQGGDLIGGVAGSFYQEGVKRKAMNFFFIRTDSEIEFFGRLNEDANMYVYYGGRGKLIFTPMFVALTQTRTQSNKGGLTDAYLTWGTYVKSFYTVMVCPSAVSISLMGNKYYRLHHNVDWNFCVPMVVSQKVKKVV
ncbi:MAG: hypothetical protein QXF86_03105 [Candidatus Bilamarchaeaceae archaeon]